MLLLLWACVGGPVKPGESGDGTGSDSAAHTGDSPEIRDTGPFDGDGDGATDAADCDDADPAIHPGAPEICDEVDNDCDGSADEQAVDALTRYVDADGDGYGDDAAAVRACGEEFGTVEIAGDCADGDPTIHPDAPEVCDLLDQDCDLEVDEGIPTDGAGCADPGWPAWDERVEVLQIVLRTHTGSTDNSDEPLYACVGDYCYGMDIADWDDREVDRIDVHTIQDPGFGRSEADRLRIYTTGGADRWRPRGVQVTLDGEAVYSRLMSNVYIGDAGGAEVTSWSEAAGVYDDTIWDSPLTLGPILGPPTDDAARIWLRTDQTRQVKLRLAATPDALADAPVVAWRYPAADRDFTELIEVQGLGAGAAWSYDLEIDGTRYGPWSLRTAPARGSGGIYKLAFGSCGRLDDQPIFSLIRAEAPDMFLFIGDNHYGDTDDLDALRQNYRWAHTRDQRRELMAEAAILATWDDHDYVGNNTDGDAPGKANALRAFTEYWANGSYGTDATAGVFSAHSYGDIDVIVIDDRYWRGLEDSITGDAQERWLVETVAASTATFKLIASGSQWNLDGSSDSWATFPEAQARVMSALSAVPGVVLLSGDIHYPEYVSIPAPGYDIPELTSSPLAYADRSDYVIFVDIDTTLADPTLHARTVNDAGTQIDDWLIPLSSLTP